MQKDNDPKTKATQEFPILMPRLSLIAKDICEVMIMIFMLVCPITFEALKRRTVYENSCNS